MFKPYIKKKDYYKYILCTMSMYLMSYRQTSFLYTKREEFEHNMYDLLKNKSSQWQSYTNKCLYKYHYLHKPNTYIVLYCRVYTDYSYYVYQNI